MPQSGIVRKNDMRQSQDGCGAANRMRSRIASPEMFPEADMLPQLICSRPSFIGGANDEADELLKPRVTASNLWARPNNATGGGGSFGNVGGCGGMGDNGDDGRGGGGGLGVGCDERHKQRRWWSGDRARLGACRQLWVPSLYLKPAGTGGISGGGGSLAGVGGFGAGAAELGIGGFGGGEGGSAGLYVGGGGSGAGPGGAYSSCRVAA